MITFADSHIKMNEVGPLVKAAFMDYKIKDYHLFGGKPNRMEVEFRHNNPGVCQKVLNILEKLQAKKKFTYFVYNTTLNGDEDPNKTSIVFNKTFRENNTVETLVKVATAIIYAAEGVVDDNILVVSNTPNNFTGMAVYNKQIIEHPTNGRVAVDDQMRNIIGRIGLVKTRSGNIAEVQFGELKTISVISQSLTPLLTGDFENTVEAGEILSGSGYSVPKELWDKYGIFK